MRGIRRRKAPSGQADAPPPLILMLLSTKRITTNVMVFLAYGAGNSLGPTFWKFGQNPPFRDGMLTCLICFTATICILLILR